MIRPLPILAAAGVALSALATAAVAAVAGLALSAVAVSAVATAAKAAEPVDPFVQRVFAKPIEGEKTYACFIRKYDAAHLAQHPKQKVTSMKVLMTAEKNAEDGSLSTSFRLGLTKRNNSHAFKSAGSCSHPEVTEGETAANATPMPSLGCGVDCDGGGIGIDLSKDNHAALVSVERVRIWRNNKPDEEASYSLEAGQDDHLFRLERVDDKQCASLVTDREELASMRKK